ncbi:tRNA pseudouridine synthase 1 [Rhizina undulata]
MTDQNETVNLAPPPATVAATNSSIEGHSRRGGNQRGRSGGRGRGSRGRGGNDGGRGQKRKDAGRMAYNRNRENRAKRQKVDAGEDGETKEGEVEGEEAEKEERKPKRKVAVLIGYCGTGYKGMQLNPPHKSIEGDLFEAMVKAGAISKANSNDPKKSSLVRCARTDKGVHAAGNVISLKLIIEDPDIVTKINSHLPDQIRVWGIVRTVGSFSCYQQCDSRRYEYLLPSHVFLPPHPKSFLAKVCRETAEKERDLEGYLERQQEVSGWWDGVDSLVEEQLLKGAENRDAAEKAFEEESQDDEPPWSRRGTPVPEVPEVKAEDQGAAGEKVMKETVEDDKWKREQETKELLKKIRAFHLAEKKKYRISPERLERVRNAFKKYQGTINFHNYTVAKSFGDPSAKRHIKTFEVMDPIIINGTEWLSIRVHGQSFMMHQIRKMVGMAMMAVRTGCPLERIPETFGRRKVSIAKAPGLGLLLESPQFGAYNTKATTEFDKDPIDFEKYKEEIDQFRAKMIYENLFEEEEKMNVFNQFVQFLDTYKSPTYTYLTSAGMKALDETQTNGGNKAATGKEAPADSEDEDAASGNEG